MSREPDRSTGTVSVRRTVTDADTAQALGSGDVEVLGTPRLIAWAEQAAVEAVRGLLSEGDTSVGAAVDVRHLAPSPIGAVVEVSAGVVDVRGRRVELAVSGRHSVADADWVEVLAGRVVRVIVDRAQFEPTHPDNARPD